MKLRLHVRGRLFVASVCVVAGVIAIAGLIAQAELRTWIEQRIEDDLSHKLAATQLAVQLSATPPDDALADRLGAALGARVTLVDASGVVRGDSEVASTRLGLVENHADRPEVTQALTRALGRDRRTSATLHKDMLYLAARTERPDGMGVARVAADYDDVDAAVARLRALLALAGAVGLMVAVGMSALASQLLSRTLRGLVTHARSLAGGAAEDDDIRGLAGTLQRLADDLAVAVGALASERDRFAAVLEAMGEGVIVLDAQARVLLVNASAHELLPTTPSRESRPPQALVEVTRLPALEDAARRAAAGERTASEVEIGAPTARTLLVRGAPVRGGGAVVVLHDVSEIRRLERVRRDFVGNVSHELRTPVSVIRASAETLLHSGVEDADASRSFLEAIERNAERLTRLVGDLLDLSRIESGGFRFAKAALPLLDLCQRAAQNIGKAQKQGHRIALDVPDHLQAIGDEKAIDQVLVNLLDNAVKYTPPGGNIALRARRVDGSPGQAPHVRVEVEDDGPGIEAHHRARLFERFYRVDAGRSRDIGGTGLGLAIVKHLVEGMGGSVGVQPAAQRGSVFFFTLPAPTPDALVTGSSRS